MALLFMEGFDTYGTDGSTRKNNFNATELREINANTAVGIVSVTVAGRNGPACMYVSSNVSRAYMFSLLFGKAVSEGGVGCAVQYVDRLPTASGEEVRTLLFRNADDTARMAVQVTAAGNINVYDNPTTSGLGTFRTGTIDSPFTATGVWRHLEVKWLCNGASSKITVKLDGVAVIDDVTITLTATEFSRVGYLSKTGNTGSSPILGYDDFYAWDTTGSVNNTFLGDCAVIPLAPTSDGSPQDFTPVGAGTGYEAIDDVEQDNDTTYITASDVGESRFGMADLTETGVVKGVAAGAFHRKTDTGDSDIRIGVNTSEGLVESADIQQSTSWAGHVRTFDTQAGSEPWTVSAVNGASLVVKRTL